MRASRLLSILILLQLRGRLTAEALAAECEVSVRTVYRDIDALSAAGVPVYGDRGPGGGFQLLDGYRTRLTGLSAAEAEALFLIGLPAQAAALGIGSAAALAGHKMLAALPPEAGATAGRVGARFHLDPVDWYRDAAPAPLLPTVARAVLDQQVLAMRYASWTRVGDWIVEPLGVVLKAGSWYLVAGGHGKIRTFRVAAIVAAAPTGDSFERPRDFDLARHWTAGLQQFEAKLRRAVATIEATAEGQKRLAALGAFAAAAVAASEGGIVRLPFETIDQAALMLLGIGPELRVVDPVELRTALHALARKVAGLSEPAAGAYMAGDRILAESPESS